MPPAMSTFSEQKAYIQPKKACSFHPALVHYMQDRDFLLYPFIQQLTKLLIGLCFVNLIPEPCRAFQPFRVPCHMLSHLTDSQIIPFKFNLHPCMAQHHIPDFFRRRTLRHPPCPFIFQKLRKYPGIPLGASCNHHPVASCLPAHTKRAYT